MVCVFLPPAMRALANGRESVEATGATVREVVRDLERQFPGIELRLLHDGALRAGLSAVINGSVAARGAGQPVPDGAELHFLPALGGG